MQRRLTIGGAHPIFILGGAPRGHSYCHADNDLAIDVMEGLISLAQKSLLQQTQQANGEPWFRMLTTIQLFSYEQLTQQGDTARYKQLHGMYYCDLVEQAETKFTSDEAIKWLNRLEHEHDNLRAALDWSIAEQQWDIALRMSGALWNFWYTRGYFYEGREWLVRALHGAHQVADAVAAKAVHAAGLLAMGQGDNLVATHHLTTAQALYERLGQQQNYARVLDAQGTLALNNNEYQKATAYYQQALAIYREQGNLIYTQGAIHNLGLVAFAQYDFATARPYLQEALVLAQQTNNTLGIVMALLARIISLLGTRLSRSTAFLSRGVSGKQASQRSGWRNYCN